MYLNEIKNNISVEYEKIIDKLLKELVVEEKSWKRSCVYLEIECLNCSTKIIMPRTRSFLHKKKKGFPNSCSLRCSTKVYHKYKDLTKDELFNLGKSTIIREFTNLDTSLL